MRRLLIVFMIITTFVLAEEFVGEGMAVLGDNITLAKAEEIAFLKAQKDASYKVGTYIESETIVDNYNLIKDEIRTISASLIKLKEGSKVVERKVINGEFYLSVKAVFTADTDELILKVEEYQKSNRANEELEAALIRVAELEEALKDMSGSTTSESIKVDKTIAELNSLYTYIDNSVSFDGGMIVDRYNKEREVLIGKLLTYLYQVKANYYKIINDSSTITGIKESKVGDEFRIELDFVINEGEELVGLEEKRRELIREIEDKDYGELLKYLPKDNYVLAMAFLDGKNEILALAYNDINRGSQDTIAYLLDSQKGIWWRPVIYYNSNNRTKVKDNKAIKYYAYISDELLMETKSIALVPFEKDGLEIGISRSAVDTFDNSQWQNQWKIILERYLVPVEGVNIRKSELINKPMEDLERSIERLEGEIYEDM